MTRLADEVALHAERVHGMRGPDVMTGQLVRYGRHGHLATPTDRPLRPDPDRPKPGILPEPC